MKLESIRVVVPITVSLNPLVFCFEDRFTHIIDPDSDMGVGCRVEPRGGSEREKRTRLS